MWSNNDLMSSNNDLMDPNWKPLPELKPKTKKKIKMYRPVRKIGNPGQYSISDTYHEFKSWFQTQYRDIIGWQEIEVEVDE